MKQKEVTLRQTEKTRWFPWFIQQYLNSVVMVNPVNTKQIQMFCVYWQIISESHTVLNINKQLYHSKT